MKIIIILFKKVIYKNINTQILNVLIIKEFIILFLKNETKIIKSKINKRKKVNFAL